MGMGQSIGLIDLPVHREVSTNWPVLSGSGIKGVLKDETKRTLGQDHASVRDFYGDMEGMGALVVTDLFALLFPVRSQNGVFAWVTCPLALSRAADLARISGRPALPMKFNPSFDATPQGFHAPGAAIVNGTGIALDELDLAAVAMPEVTQLATAIAVLTQISEEQLKGHLCVVPDDVFTFLTEQGTEVRTRTALQFGSKKVKDGSLRTEEYLPAYAVFLGHGMIPVGHEPPSHLQVGAEASIGAGLVLFKATGGSR
jgi:CRISPR-associated protein Cmr4